ncbi:diacylglycerol O-acyltransferase 1 [Lignoscripta atroalba]|nr:diacylglycerol O-acyltransferase 1 [Lignoscripta atroalba]
MAHNANDVLNLEPSRPEVRKENQLPPKTYADAVEENLESYGKKDFSTPVQYIGQGEDNAPRSPMRKAHKRNGSVRVNGTEKEKVDHKVPLERFEDADGKDLTSIRPTSNYKDALRQDEKEQKPLVRRNAKDELVSGRRAGAGWQRSGIRFAPMNIPLQRRLQTLVVLFHTLCVALLLTTFFFLCAIPLFWPLLLPYLLYVLFSRAPHSGTLSHRSKFLRSMKLWSLFASYFPARLHRSQVLPPTRKYIFGYHPHGIISHGAFAAFATEALGFSQLFPGITNTLLTLDTNFRIPLYRDYALAMGLASVSRESCENILSKGGPNGEGMGRAITIVVGGAAESLDAQPYSLRLVLKKRKGFIKLAIRTGADLVPVLSFGENELYDQVRSDSHPLIHKAQIVLKKALGFTIPLFHARGVFNYDIGMMPYRRPLNVVVGRPIKVAQHAQPHEAYVDEIHGLYVRELERIWGEWKDVFASERTGELEIVE